MASSIGGYDYEFLTDLPEDLTCVLCHFAFKNPVQVEECGHVFCKQCFDNMKDHAASNCIELLCPLDRQNIDVTRVFKDKSDERRVLNLMVKCQNFGDKCDWTGELRQALEHKTNCCKDETILNQAFELSLKELIKRITQLELKSEVLENSIAEKDVQILNQNHQIASLSRHNVNQDQQIINLERQIENQNNSIGDQNKQIVSLNKQVADQNKQIVNLNIQSIYQNTQIVEQKKQMENLQKSQTHQPTNHQSSTLPLSMIVPNIQDESNYSLICTAFQWKFKPTEVKSGRKIFSPPFYNNVNAYCFQLSVQFGNNNFSITLLRYRGKYDHNVNEIKVTKDIDFQIRIFGKNGILKTAKWVNLKDYSIAKNEMTSGGWGRDINNSEIDSFTVDGYVHLHCFFNNTLQC